MNIAKSLFELQSLDSEIQSINNDINAISERLIKSERLVTAEEKLQASRENALQTEKKRKEVELEVDELEKSIKQISNKLYGGTVKNPKELLSYEQELKDFKEKLQKKEDSLLSLMTEEEQSHVSVKNDSEEVDKIKSEWHAELPDLEIKRSQLESAINTLTESRENIISELDAATLKLYDSIKQRKGQAVVKIEQGRCQKCRISLSVNELQKAKTGSVIHCSSCGLILYLS